MWYPFFIVFEIQVTVGLAPGYRMRQSLRQTLCFLAHGWLTHSLWLESQMFKCSLLRESWVYLGRSLSLQVVCWIMKYEGRKESLKMIPSDPLSYWWENWGPLKNCGLLRVKERIRDAPGLVLFPGCPGVVCLLYQWFIAIFIQDFLELRMYQARLRL